MINNNALLVWSTTPTSLYLLSREAVALQELLLLHKVDIVEMLTFLFLVPRVCPSRPFTPYSTTLGGVVRELHRCLLLAITAEPHPQTLSHIIKV